MQLGAAHPMGPIALLDYIGLDVSVAIGDAIEADVPQSLRDLCAEGALGRKAGRGLYPPEAVRALNAVRLGALQALVAPSPCEYLAPPPRSTRRARHVCGPVVVSVLALAEPPQSTVPCLRRPTGGVQAATHGRAGTCANSSEFRPESGYAPTGSLAGSSRFSRMRTASMRFSRTDSTRIV